MTNMEDMDALLAAYADGELDQATATAVESHLAENPAAQRMLTIHRETTALLRAAFPETLFARTPETQLTSVRARLSRPGLYWAFAASILIGVMGYGAGAMWPDLIVSNRDRMLTEVAEYHAVYSRETTHLVEVPATQSDHLKSWLGKRVKGTLVIPDFKEAGLTFAGGRMVVLDGAPVAELMYTREKGLPIAFCVLYREGKPIAIKLERRGAVHLATWDDGSHSYIVVGEADPALIGDLAAMAKKQI
ncbi:MAG: anti-sigma factor [Acetobacteraceae bacterium]|nr:anti-sigma factor [Acetobacteraceae bacterium]